VSFLISFFVFHRDCLTLPIFLPNRQAASRPVGHKTLFTCTAASKDNAEAPSDLAVRPVSGIFNTEKVRHATSGSGPRQNLSERSAPPPAATGPASSEHSKRTASSARREPVFGGLVQHGPRLVKTRKAWPETRRDPQLSGDCRPTAPLRPWPERRR